MEVIKLEGICPICRIFHIEKPCPMKEKEMESQPTLKYESHPSKKPHRVQMLETVANLITQDRNLDYGDPQVNMQRTVDMLKAYLGDRRGSDLTAEDIAAFGIILKLGRLAESRETLDSWMDIAGYSAIGYECLRLRGTEPAGSPAQDEDWLRNVRGGQ